MKTKRIVSAVAAVMMAAMAVAPQLPASVPLAGINNVLTAEAVKNAVDVSVVDAKTGAVIDGVEVRVDRLAENLSGRECEFVWNTTDNPSKEVTGAHDWIRYVALYNVPENYVYDDQYIIDLDTLTTTDYTIRLRKKSDTANFILNFANCSEGSMLRYVNFNIYDNLGRWVCQVKDQDGVFLQDGKYVLKADDDVLRKAGYSIDGVKEVEFSVKDGVSDIYDCFYMVEDLRGKEQNIFFKIKNRGDTEASSEGIRRVVITGEGFSKIVGSSTYLGDGHYIAHCELMMKDPFKMTGNTNIDQARLDSFIDQMMYDVEDIEFNVIDGKPDRDLVFVKNPVVLPSAEEKSDAKITIRDKISGMCIEGIDVEVIAGINATEKSIAKWNTSDELEKVLKDLTVNPDYKYGVKLSNVPEGFSYKDRYIFDVAKANITENWVIELERENPLIDGPSTDRLVSATVSVRDKITGKNIEGVDVVLMANVNGTARKIAEWNTSDAAEKVVNGLEPNPYVLFGVDLKNVPEEYDFNDRYFFGFKGDYSNEEWTVELLKKGEEDPDKDKATAKVSVRDMATGKNIGGIDVEVIAGVNASEKSIAKWNTSDSPEKILTGLSKNSEICYGIKLTNVPEEYRTEDGYNFFVDKDAADNEWSIGLVKKDVPENVSVGIYNWSTRGVYDILQNGKPFYAKITNTDGTFCCGFSGSDKHALPDGMYTFTLVTPPEGYVIVEPESEYADALRKKYGDNITIKGSTVYFMVKNGKPDTELLFDIMEVPVDTPVKPPEGDIGFRLYSRYKGLWEENGGVGSVTIKDSKDKEVGKYDLNEKISLPDGKYTSVIDVYCKGYSCFSEGIIEFNVKDGKPDKNLDYNIEAWNFDENGSGDANGDKKVDISDSVLIMQSLANPSKYGSKGSDKNHITDEGKLRADVDGGGVTNMDALMIQKYLLGFFRFE